MTPERIAWLAENDPVVSELALMWRAWAWTDRGLSDPRPNTETEVAGAELERRALDIVYSLRAEGWSTLQRATILTQAVTQAIGNLRPAAKDLFYSSHRKRVRSPRLREALRGLKGDWRTWTCKQ